MNLNFKTFGTGEPLIILHGLLGSLDNWQTLAKKYAEDFTVFIIDQRNHGKSPHSDSFSYPILSNDLLEFCEQNHLYSTHVLGHSMGGKVAMQFALDNPDMVNKLIVADIAPVNYPAGHNEIFNALLNVDLASAKSRKEIENVLAESITEFSTRQFLMKGLTRGDDNKFEWKFNVDALWKNYESILTKIESEEQFEGQTLFINGSNSSYVQPAYYEEIDQLFPNNIKATIQGAGHWLHAEKPEEFYEKTKAFLS